MERRAERAETLVHLGELSSGRQALEGAALAPGNEETRRALTDATRRPPTPRAPLSEDLLTHQPAVPFMLSKTVLLKNLKCAKRGAAGGLNPVGIATRMGRMTALQKPSGGVRGIVVGDFVRRLVSRIIAQQFSPAVERATAPFQYALTTRAGCECIGHILQVETDSNCERTVLSVDGIGASISCRGNQCSEGCSLSKVANQSCRLCDNSTYWWQDDAGGEGGEQRDALMPALFCLGALVAVERQLRPDERLMVFLDDLYVSCNPDRVAPISDVLRRELWTHSRIQIHLGKTQIWNRGGVESPGWHRLAADAWASDPDAIVWRGDHTLPPEHQGVSALGTPLGSPQFVSKELEKVATNHQVLLDRIPHVQDLQSAWLLLLFCASPRPNNILRMLHPVATREFARQHDLSVKRCLEQILHTTIPEETWTLASMPLVMGRAGFEECTERETSFILGQLGGCVAHGVVTSSCSR